MSLKIRSTEKLASSNTQGLCDVERTIKSFSDEYNNKGEKVNTIVVIESRMFQEKTIQQTINEGELDEEIINVVERKYIPGNDHIHPWKFSAEEIIQMETAMAELLTGLNEEEKRLSVFIQLTKTAGEYGNGWQGMSNWIPESENYTIVTQFTQ